MKVSTFGRRAFRIIGEKLEHFRSKIRSFMTAFLALSRKFPRRLAKELIIIFSLSLTFITVVNLLLPETVFEKTKMAVLVDNHNSLAYRSLGQQFFKVNDFTQSSEELRKAFILSPIQESREEILQELKTVSDTQGQPGQIEKEIVRWQEILSVAPGYRDAYIKLAILNWKIYRDFDARKFLDKALEIDPNNEVARKLEGLISFPQQALPL